MKLLLIEMGGGVILGALWLACVFGASAAMRGLL